MMLGGTVEFSSRSHQSGSLSDASGFTFAPSFGYFIVDNLAAGAVITLESSRLGTGAAKTVNSSFGFGPFVRYYKFTSNEKFAFFGNAERIVNMLHFDVHNGLARRAWARNRNAIFSVEREMKTSDSFSVTLPNDVNDDLLDATIG